MSLNGRIRKGERDGKREKERVRFQERKREISSAGSFPKWP